MWRSGHPAAPLSISTIMSETGNQYSLDLNRAASKLVRQKRKFLLVHQRTSAHRTLRIHLLLAGISLLLSLASAAAAGLVLADHGLSHYKIVIAGDASPTVKHAAHELAED